MAALALLLTAAAADAAVPRAFYGLNPQVRDPLPAEFNRMGEGGVGTYRFMLSWPQLQHERGAGFRWQVVDRIVEPAAENGIRLLPFFYGTADFVACPYRGERNCRTSFPLRTHAALDAWKRFLAATVRRYGPDGRFWDPDLDLSSAAAQLNGIPITAYQIWNEENSQGYAHPEASPRRYGRLLKASKRAIRMANAGSGERVRLVLGGMFGTPPHRSSMNSWTFLNKLYDVRGVKRAFDMVALHPYSPGLRGIRYQIDHVRDVMRRHNDVRLTGMWVTEIGWGSASDRNALTKGPTGQARMLRKSFQMLRSHRFEWKLRGVLWYSWHDFVPGACANWCSSSGLLRNDLSAKPAWTAYKRFTPG